MNTKTREAYLDDELIEGLTPKEFDLLYTLAKKPRQVFSREKLLELVWDYQYFGDERTVDAHIKNYVKKWNVSVRKSFKPFGELVISLTTRVLDK